MTKTNRIFVYTQKIYAYSLTIFDAKYIIMFVKKGYSYNSDNMVHKFLPDTLNI